jgi:hypothetical protein
MSGKIIFIFQFSIFNSEIVGRGSLIYRRFRIVSRLLRRSIASFTFKRQKYDNLYLFFSAKIAKNDFFTIAICNKIRRYQNISRYILCTIQEFKKKFGDNENKSYLCVFNKLLN